MAVRRQGNGRGRVTRVNGPLVECEGLERVAVMENIDIGAGHVTAEVVSVQPGRLTAQVYDYTSGLSVGTPVAGTGRPLSAWLGPWLLGGSFDGLLRPLEGAGTWMERREQSKRSARHWAFRPSSTVGDRVSPGDVIGLVPTTSGLDHRVLVPQDVSGIVDYIAAGPEMDEDEPVARVEGRPVMLGEYWPVRRPRPVRKRLGLGEPLVTGQRVIDLLYPIAKGSTAAVPGGFGTGKTMLLQQILKWCQADVIVYVGCGERGNELADALADLYELKDSRTGGSLIDRTVVIANTSNMPVMAREASIYTGMTVAEYFRDMGYDAVLLADSTSRWAEALREFASRNGELPAEEGYPASLASALAAFYERAGRVVDLNGSQGSVTAIGAVSPPGGDMTEPVSAQTERFVRCLWSLDRGLAYARHYPAVSWRRSFSRDAETVAAWHTAEGDSGWGDDRRRAIALLAEADRLEPMVELVGLGGLPDRDRATLLAARTLREAVLQQNALSRNDARCGPGKEAALLRAVIGLAEKAAALVEGGVRAETLERYDLSELTRLRDEVPPDAADAVNRRASDLLARMELAVTA